MNYVYIGISIIGAIVIFVVSVLIIALVVFVLYKYFKKNNQTP